MRKGLFLSLALSFVFGAFLLATPASAANAPVEDPLGLKYGQASGLGNQDVRTTASRVINVGLTLLGTIFLVLTVYAGFLWMTAAGNDDRIGTAKQILGASVIGLVIVLSAYAITNFVVKQGFEATQGEGSSYGEVPALN